MSQRVYSCSMAEAQELKKFIEYDPFLDKAMTPEQLQAMKTDENANIIFTRQDYLIKDGISLGLDREKCYLYINATEEFLVKGEKKLKEKIKSIERVPPELETKIITDIETERKQSEEGLGAIFG